MQWTVVNCDILDRKADILVLSGNPQLNLSGGAGGAFSLRYGDQMQQELHQYLKSNGMRYVNPGSVVVMPPCGSPFSAVLHAIGIDAFYDTSPELVAKTIRKSLQIAASLFAKTVALTAIATGYGKLSIADFAAGVQSVVDSEFTPVEFVDICVLKTEVAEELVDLLPGAVAG